VEVVIDEMSDPELFSPENIEAARKALAGDVERREVLARMGRWAGGLLLAACLGPLVSCGSRDTPVVQTTVPAGTSTGPGPSDLAIASGRSPGGLARKSVDALGGMGRFVDSGDVVVVKPNASFMDGLENATTTNPEVVGQVVAMCREAGASRVIVIDHVLCGSVADGFGPGSGIGKAVESNGGEVLGFSAGDKGHGVLTAIPQARSMNSTSIYPEVLQAEVVITVPKAKHHSGTGLTLGMKNFIGVTANMSDIHNYDTHRAIADLNTLVKPTLSVIDASVILLSNGPGGPGTTRDSGQVIASTDVVAADSCACTLFGLAARDVPHIIYGGEAGLGEVDYNNLKIARV